ncbi:acyl carrier protein [Kitasatospora sp. NPDC002040]|uniref:acyl carrier protein n=1 Tax=Kitasatospora sp. NPDC002040 TaxID=3154661 RepID=UPI0033191A1F
MPVSNDPLALVQSIIAGISERPVDDIRPEHRLLEDLSMDSLQITELAQKLENALGRYVDDDLLNVDGATVALCAEVAQNA